MPTEDHTSSERSHQGLPQEGVELSLDELAKGLATGTLSRGKALRWMGGALLGAAFATVPGVAWANDCRRLGRECRRDSQCCSKNCVRRGDEKVCGCPEGKRRCGDRCVNLKRNERHCGECFHHCDEGEECVRGECKGTSCPPGETVCGGECCAEGQECVEGMCIDTTCPPDRILTEGDCDCGFICNAGFPPFACQDIDRCTCFKTTEGTGFCAGGGGPCSEIEPCSSSLECENRFPGWKCVVDTCLDETCGFTGATCLPPCSPITSTA